MEILCPLHLNDININCDLCDILENTESYKNILKYEYQNKNFFNNYKPYRSQYTQHNDSIPLKYSPRIYLTKIIDKYYYNNKDIRSNKDKILNFNDQFENAYKKIKDSKRKNSLNIHFKLYKFLQLCSVKSNISDFKIHVKNKKILDEYELIWKEICITNNWKSME